MKTGQNGKKWAKLVLKIFPSIKRKDTEEEVSAIEKIITNYYEKVEVKIVDVCCGWGRHCFELAKRGYPEVIGIDIASQFINYAKETLKGFTGKSSPKFVNKDLFEVDFKEDFDVALNLWTSFGLYEEDDKNIEMLNKIATFLKKGGIFILDVANGERLGLKLNIFLDNKEYIPGNKNWWRIDNDTVALAQVDFNLWESTAVFHFSLFEKNKRFHDASIIKLKIYSLAELKNMLAKAGFKVKAVYGDFKLNPYSFISPRLIIVSEKS